MASGKTIAIIVAVIIVIVLVIVLAVVFGGSAVLDVASTTLVVATIAPGQYAVLVPYSYKGSHTSKLPKTFLKPARFSTKAITGSTVDGIVTAINPAENWLIMEFSTSKPLLASTSAVPTTLPVDPRAAFPNMDLTAVTTGSSDSLRAWFI